MRLVAVARSERHCGELGARSPQSHRAAQPHQGGKLLGRNPDDAPKTTFQRTLTQTDIPRQVVYSFGPRSPLKPGDRGGHEWIGRGNTYPAEQEILQPLYASWVVLSVRELFVKAVELVGTIEDASEIGGCSGKLFQRRTQKSRCAHRP